jgi:hypothetical protein
VFAHEIGHVAHRHFLWYLALMGILILFSLGPIRLALYPTGGDATMLREQIGAVVELLLMVVAYVALTRRFERQADVYAARTIQALRDRVEADARPVIISHVNPALATVGGGGGGLFNHGLATAAVIVGRGGGGGDSAVASRGSYGGSYVGEYGAAVVASALHRVARVNHIPLAANEWLHGSISSRMAYLRGIAGDAGHTRRFDKSMRRMYWGMMAILVALAVWVGTDGALNGWGKYLG